MAATPSTMLELGTPAPDFALRDAVSGKTLTRDDALEGAKALLVMFVCNHCPFVVHVQPELTRLDRDYAGKGVSIVAINSNDVEQYPDDAPSRMKELVEEKGWSFPFLHDESQEVAQAYRAACTPDFFLFDAAGRLVYRGQLDATRPGGDPPHGADLRAALDAVLDGRAPDPDQKPSLGCNIKWKAGNAPEYFG